MITFTINGKEVKGRDGWTILDVARSSGIEIPTLCQHGAVKPSGACRLCVVEVSDGKKRRMVASCLYPIREGIEVHTESEPVENVRRWILQMLMDEHPGSERIKELAITYGVKESRFRSDNLEDTCILCGLCIRSCEEVAGVSAISFGRRGVQKEVATPRQTPNVECVGCGTCLYVCPTGAMDRLFKKVRVLPAMPENLAGITTAERRRQ